MTCQQAKTIRQEAGNDTLWPDARITDQTGLQTAPKRKTLVSKTECHHYLPAKKHDLSIMTSAIRPDTIFKSP